MSEKQKFKKNPHNYAVKKTLLLKQRVSYVIIEGVGGRGGVREGESVGHEHRYFCVSSDISE